MGSHERCRTQEPNRPWGHLYKMPRRVVVLTTDTLALVTSVHTNTSNISNDNSDRSSYEARDKYGGYADLGRLWLCLAKSKTNRYEIATNLWVDGKERWQRILSRNVT